MISWFVDIVLRHGRSEPGLFGPCSAYYGTVECQARGTLHCHMLIWVAGHPSPQDMRTKMSESEQYRTDMCTWLEDIIKCEFLGTTSVEPMGDYGQRPCFAEDGTFAHPGTLSGPRFDWFTPEVFALRYKAHVNDLVERFNWHEHTETCWKYLRPSDPRDDAHCRMRMDGTTRAVTVIDDESGSILLRRLHPMIANYNDLVVFLLKCNMDIKHIGSGEGAKALIYYVTDYITKAPIPTHMGLAALLYAIDRTNMKCGDVVDRTQLQERSAFTTMVNSMLCRSEVSHQQVMSYLVGGGDHYTSHRFRILHLRSFER
ncbi:hypothetical protein C8Q80DRAFT_1079565, partial [Daedaleopsis nitida]